MEKIIVTSESQLNEIISKSVNLEFRRVLLELKPVEQQTHCLSSKFGDLGWFISIHPKNPAKATVYSNICSGKIPKYLMYKPEGSKKVLFYKELVMQWIDDGFPVLAQPKADVNTNNIK